MYRGRILEAGPAEKVVHDPAHPYTRQLLAARLSIDPGQRMATRAVGPVGPGAAEQSQCVFYDRCPVAIAACASADIPFVEVAGGHRAACIRAAKGDPTEINPRPRARMTP